MVRLGNVFSNIRSKINQFGSKLGSSFHRIAPKALLYWKSVAGGLSQLPGVIGTAAGIVHRGMDYADRVINSLPDSSLKSKLQSLEKGGSEFVNKVENKANQIGQTSKVIGDTANKVLNAIGKPPPIL